MLRITNMRLKAFLVLLFFNLIYIGSTLATIDYLLVNHYTKQLYWAGTDHPAGLIGWEGVGENYHAEESAYLELGYTYTDNPFLIEQAIILAIITLLLSYWLFRKKRRANLNPPRSP